MPKVRIVHSEEGKFFFGHTPKWLVIRGVLTDIANQIGYQYAGHLVVSTDYLTPSRMDTCQKLREFHGGLFFPGAPHEIVTIIEPIYDYPCFEARRELKCIVYDPKALDVVTSVMEKFAEDYKLDEVLVTTLF